MKIKKNGVKYLIELSKGSVKKSTSFSSKVKSLFEL